MTRAQEKRPAAARLPEGARIACVVSTYHHEITGAMRDSAAAILETAGLHPRDLIEVRVPGAFELPLVAQLLAERDDVAAVLCFGLVLRGETDHDRHIARAVAHGLMQASLTTETPILFGVLTCENLEQARARARRVAEGGLDKGREVALAALEVLAAVATAEQTR